MAEIKKYLDFEGLARYDEKIKALIKASAGDISAIKELVGELPADATESTILAYLENKIGAVDEKVGDISELTGETVSNLAMALKAELDRAANAEKELSDRLDIIEGEEEVEGSIRNIAREIAADEVGKVMGEDVREDLDSIKEIVEALAGEEAIQGLSNVVSRLNGIDSEVVEIKENAKDIEAHVDEVEAKVNSFVRITEDEIDFLFLEEVKPEAGKSIQESINGLAEGQKLVLEENVAEDLVIPANAVIDANGKEFEGQVEVEEGAHILNATFKNPVIVK